jgi:hypothetical protein
MNAQGKTMTHEAYIQNVRALAVARLSDEGERKALEGAKLVYGCGNSNLRGVTHFNAWKNGTPEAHALAEVCAFGESDPVQLAGTCLHELAHILAGHGAGHGPKWRAACTKLGLRFCKAAGTKYTPACFTADVRIGIAALPKPTDGKPLAKAGGIEITGLLPRPCSHGIGSRGGKSRGKGSGSRLRKWVCGCGVIARVSRDEFKATCNLCGTAFKRADVAQNEPTWKAAA